MKYTRGRNLSLSATASLFKRPLLARHPTDVRDKSCKFEEKLHPPKLKALHRKPVLGSRTTSTGANVPQSAASAAVARAKSNAEEEEVKAGKGIFTVDAASVAAPALLNMKKIPTGCA